MIPTLHKEVFIHRPYHPKRRIIVLTIETVARHFLENVVEISRILQVYDIKLLSCIIDSHPHEERSYATIFLDLSSTNIQPTKLIEEVRKINGVTYAAYTEIPLTHGTAHLVTFTLHDMFSLIDAAHRRFGNIGKVFLFHEGHEVGTRKAEELMAVFKAEEAIKHMLHWIQSLGWGRVELIECTPSIRCLLRIRNLFECAGVKSEEPRSHLFRGFLAGFFSKVWNRQVSVVETRCIAKGDPYCEFLITSQM